MNEQRKITVLSVLNEGYLLGVKNAASIIVATILWLVTIWIPYLNVGTTIAMATLPVALSKGKVISPFLYLRENIVNIWESILILLD